jgi:magnesium chelatase family protein
VSLASHAPNTVFARPIPEVPVEDARQSRATPADAVPSTGAQTQSPSEQSTVAHRGTLFLNELGEFAPAALDALRQPLGARSVHISRQPISLQFPAAFQLVACTNPCPCGRADDECRCSDVQRARYRRRLSGPLLDRFDLRVHVRPLAAASPRGGSSPRSPRLR